MIKITTSFPPGSPILLSLINLAVLKTTIHSVQNPRCNLMYDCVITLTTLGGEVRPTNDTETSVKQNCNP